MLIAGASAELAWAARTAVLACGIDTPILVDLAREHAACTRPAPGPLSAAAEVFGLTPAETSALALVAAVEIDARFGALVAQLQGTTSLRPTVGTLLELVGLESVAAFLPTGALCGNALVDLEGDGPLVFRTVRCPCWARLAGAPAAPPAPPQELGDLVLAPEVATALRAVGEWLATPDGARGLVVLWGRPGSGRDAAAYAIATQLGARAAPVSADGVTDARAFAEIERDARWAGRVPVLTSEVSVPAPAARTWLDRSTTPRIWIQAEVPDWLVDASAPARVVHIPELATEQRAEVWRRALRRPPGDALPVELAHRFRYGPARIARVVAIAKGRGEVTVEAVVAASRATSRPGIAVLAEHLDPREREDLVVPPNVGRELAMAIAWAASHARLYGAWGLATSVARARGVTLLFAGPPGTGKTLAAQILAAAIDRDLFRVDLAQAVSKWLGETEKNLGRIFDEARDAGAVLFFDEADALFAKRTAIADANDRYANLETGYLLQRLERHDGVVILATNRQQDLDSAFQRRFEVIIDFVPPGPAEREQLWRRHLPAEARCATDVSAPALATMFELTGGQIRNAIITSVALTVQDDAAATHLEMRHLIGGATRELMRAGRLVNPADFGEWATVVRAVVGATTVQR